MVPVWTKSGLASSNEVIPVLRIAVSISSRMTVNQSVQMQRNSAGVQGYKVPECTYCQSSAPPPPVHNLLQTTYSFPFRRLSLPSTRP